ncbi:hypothetical protein AAII07_53230 [Microvirga sp. 0TCS3.31]
MDPHPWAAKRISTASHSVYDALGRSKRRIGISRISNAHPLGSRRNLVRGMTRTVSPVTAASSRRSVALKPEAMAAVSLLDAKLVTGAGTTTITIELPDTALEIRSAKRPSACVVESVGREFESESLLNGTPAGEKTTVLRSDDVAEELPMTGLTMATPHE